VTSASELERAAREIAPNGDVYVKAAQGGYDGRSQAVLHSPTDAHKAWLYLGAEMCVAEKALDIEYEISVLAARSPRGEVSIFPPALNHHTNRILDWSVLPAPIPDALAVQASELARAIAEKLDIIGLVAVEMFVLKASGSTPGELLVNELAPRPHNSYHASERACATSQFEQVVRAICNLPLGSTEIKKPAAIVNLLGDLWVKHPHPDFAAALAVSGVRLHLYEKQVPKPGRKMGHLSAIGNTPQEAVERVQEAKAILDR
jgi:5-(carboxyamino)imidazole ribonucleotide synthase